MGNAFIEAMRCAITTDDTIACWGYNKYGQTDAPAGTYRSVSTGEFHTCAVATDNTVVCWGNDRGGRTDAPDGTYQSITVHTESHVGHYHGRHSCRLAQSARRGELGRRGPIDTAESCPVLPPIPQNCTNQGCETALSTRHRVVIAVSSSRNWWTRVD